MDDLDVREEVFRLMRGKTRRDNTRARWDNVFRLYQEGRTLAEIAKWIGKSESTARQLLKRAALEKQKQPGFQWPVTEDGKKICDIPHPMPMNEYPYNWHHARAKPVPPRTIQRPVGLHDDHAAKEPKRMYCPVCKKLYPIALPLVTILT